MKKSALLTIAVIGLLLINLGTLTFIIFSREPDARMRGGEGPKYIIIERLSLDAAQQAAYEKMIEQHRKRTQELREESRTLHKDLYALLKENAPDTVQVNAIKDNIALNQKQIEDLNFSHFMHLRSLCRGEQIEKFNALANDLAHLFAPGPPH
jgi:Spy/CpxP family protein refolding chaperone